MCLHDGGLLIGGCLLLGLAELLDESERLALETALEATAGAGVDKLTNAKNIPRYLTLRCELE